MVERSGLEMLRPPSPIPDSVHEGSAQHWPKSAGEPSRSVPTASGGCCEGTACPAASRASAWLPAMPHHLGRNGRRHWSLGTSKSTAQASWSASTASMSAGCRAPAVGSGNTPLPSCDARIIPRRSHLISRRSPVRQRDTERTQRAFIEGKEDLAAAIVYHPRSPALASRGAVDEHPGRGTVAGRPSVAEADWTDGAFGVVRLDRGDHLLRRDPWWRGSRCRDKTHCRQVMIEVRQLWASRPASDDGARQQPHRQDRGDRPHGRKIHDPTLMPGHPHCPLRAVSALRLAAEASRRRAVDPLGCASTVARSTTRTRAAATLPATPLKAFERELQSRLKRPAMSVAQDAPVGPPP
jgi:hypothetical protein